MAIEKAQEEKVKAFYTEITRFGRYINRIKAGSAATEEWIRKNVIPRTALEVKTGADGDELFGRKNFLASTPYLELLKEAEGAGYKFKSVEVDG